MIRSFRPWLAGLCLALTLGGCAPKTYLVELEDGREFYATPPVVYLPGEEVYEFNVNKAKLRVPLRTVRVIDRAAEICHKSPSSETYYCFDALYSF